MAKSRDRKTRIFYSAAVLLFFALSFGSGITRIYGFTLFPDEFGYWSPAAAIAGYDWSGVTAHGSYYSFGYSLLLAPILFFCQYSLQAYRIALLVNALLLGAAFVLLQTIIKKLIPCAASAQCVLGAGIALCYPPCLLYRNMTMTETLLVFCFVLLCRLLLWYLERPAFGRFAAAGISAVYMYTVHMRSLPILCACVCCMAFAWLKKGCDIRYGMRACKKTDAPDEGLTEVCPAVSKHRQRAMLLAALAVVCAAIFCAAHIKELTQDRVYGEAGRAMLSVNDYDGLFAGIKGIFTWNGFAELIVSLIGKVYYLSLASFGLFFAGVWYFIKRMTENRAAVGERIFSMFILLSCAGEILVCAVFTRGYGRIDSLCYGRYDELILAVLMAFGFFAVIHMKYPLRYAASVIFSGLIVTAVLETIIQNRQLTDINGGYFIPGLSYLLRYAAFEPECYFWKAYAFAVVLIVLMLTVLLIVRRRKELTWLLLVWIGVETLLGMSLTEDMVYRQSRVRYRDMHMVTVLRELSGEENAAGMDVAVPERRIVCYGGADAGSYAAVVQFELRDETIHFFTSNQADRLREYDLVMACESEDREALAGRYAEHEVYGIFHLYYNAAEAEDATGLLSVPE